MFLRKLIYFLTIAFKPRIASLNKELRHEFKVGITDLDENIHMNNARYLSYTELVRSDFMFRTGIFRYALKNKLMAVVANSSIVYRRPLAPFQKFEIVTKVAHLTEQTAFFKHEFISRGQICAVAVVEGRLIRKGKTPSFTQLAKDLGLEATISTEAPPELVQHQKSVIKSLLRNS